MTSLQFGAEMNGLDFEVKRSKVKVTARPHMSSKHCWEAFSHLTCLWST